MSNLLKKRGSQSVWVPPVVRQYTVPRSEVITDTHWVKTVTYETIYIPPSQGGSIGGSWQSIDGRLMTHIKHADGGATNVYEVTRYTYTTTQRTVTVYDTQTVVLQQGYWLSSEEAPTWEHGAHSIAKGAAPWSMQFTVPKAAQGVVVGAASVDTPSAADLRQRIGQGFYVAGDQVLLWSIVSGQQPVQMLAPLPQWSAQSVFKLQSDGRHVTWLVDDVAVAMALDAKAGQEVVMQAALFGVSDEVDTPAFEAVSGAVARLKVRPVVRMNEVQNSASVRVGVGVFAHNYSNHLRDRRKPRLLASGAGSWARISMRRRSKVLAYGIPSNLGAAAIHVKPRMAAHGYTEGVASVKVHPVVRSMEAQPPSALSVGVARDLIGAYKQPWMGSIAHEQPSMQARITATVGRQRAVASLLKSRDGVRSGKALHRLLKEHLQVSIELQGRMLLDGRIFEVLHAGSRVLVGALLDVQLDETLQAMDDTQAQRLLEELLRERLAAQAGVTREALLNALVSELLGVTVLQDLGAPAEVWSVTDTGQSSEESTSYTDYPFTGFANIGGRYFGAADDGLYELEGETDQGAPIEAVIDLGQRDFATNAIKSLANAYVSTDSRMPLRLQVELNGQSYTYLTRGADTNLRTQRFDLGRGLRGHFFGLKVANLDGADFELDGLEFVAQESKRRV